MKQQFDEMAAKIAAQNREAAWEAFQRGLPLTVVEYTTAKAISDAMSAAYRQALDRAADLIIEAKRGRFAPHTANWEDCLDEIVAELRPIVAGQVSRKEPSNG